MKNTTLGYLAFILVLGMAASAFAQQENKPDGYRTAFGYSFYLDACGDNDFGAAVRKAVTAKVDQCPFTDAEKQNFHAFAEDSARQSKQQIDLYVLQHKALPERFKGAKKSCKEQMASPEYIQQRNLYVRYAKGQASLNDVLPGSCESGGSITQ